MNKMGREHWWKDGDTRLIGSTRRIICPSVLSTINPTRSGMGLRQLKGRRITASGNIRYEALTWTENSLAKISIV